MAGPLTAAFMRIFVYILIPCLLFPCAWCQCEHDAYEHNGLRCCNCGPGQIVKEHCTVSNTSAKCAYCERGTYKSVPGQSTCEPCTSCTHPDANLEEDTPCSHSTNRKCRCKNGYYCLSTTVACTVCLPCTKCDNGVEVACTKHNDTVCKTKGDSPAGFLVGVLILVGVLVFVAAIGIFVWWRKCQGKNNQEAGPEEQPMNPIPDDIDLQRHMPDLVNVIGWKDMRMIALSGGIQKTEIDNCQLSHQTDVNEQTMALLDIYIERQGRGAGQKLRDSLLKRGKKNKAQEVEHILLQDGRNHCSV